MRATRFLLAVPIVAAALVGACSGDDSTNFNSGTGGNAGADGGGTDGGVDAGPDAPPFAPAAGGMRRLTVTQYVRSVALMLGEQAALAAAPPRDAQDNGFDTIGGSKFALSESQVAEYEASAFAVARAAVQDTTAYPNIVPCTPSGPADAACMDQLVKRLGRLAWRRPLTSAEVTRLVQLGKGAASHPDINDFKEGVVYAIAALLTSPDFIYMVELGEPDPKDSSRRLLTPWELAARMSFFLLAQTPSDDVLDRVQNGQLDSDDEIRALAKEMVQQPGARDALASFYAENWRLRELPDAAKNPQTFPDYSPELADSMQQETLRLIEDVIWTRNANMHELFTADYTFVDTLLAKHYGVTAPSGGGFAKVTLPKEQTRSGMLGHSSILSRFAHPTSTSPTKRGLFVQTALLCETIKPPPPGVVTDLPPDDPTIPKTMKQKLLEHQTDPGCASCHASMDPVGFALEMYDGTGAYRTKDNGLPLDTAADVGNLGTFDNAKELGQILADDPRTGRCLVINLIRQSMGHVEIEGETRPINDLDAAFNASGYKVQELLVELTVSPAFRYVGDPK